MDNFTVPVDTPPPDGEAAPNPPSQLDTVDSAPVLNNRILSFPMLSVLLAGVAGFGASWVADRVVRRPA
ncbi:MAG: hypothetical protein WDN06_07045 [Asticcacaulis sp.]